MGTPAFRAPILPRVLTLLLTSGALLASIGPGGCKSKEGSSKISSGLFIAPITEPPTADGQGGIIVRADRLDILRGIRPNDLDSVLEESQATVRVLGRLSSSRIDPATGRPALMDDLLVYEALSRSVLSVNLCVDSARPDCGKVKLNYDKGGLDAEQGQGGVLDPGVTPIKLKNGWIVAFDVNSRNLVAFRAEEPRQIVDDVDGDGVAEARTLAYRSDLGPDGKPNVADKNFGNGNGVLLSVVMEGEDWIDPQRIRSEPEVSRIVEIEENELLVFFTAGTVQSIELLELHEETVKRDFDTNLPVRQSELLEVKVLKGVRKAFLGAPLNAFLAYSTIAQQVTQNQGLILDSFQPVLIPDPKHPDPDPGVILVFDKNTSTFMRIGIARNAAGEILGGVVGTAITTEKFTEVLQGNTGAATATPPFLVVGGFYNGAPGKTEILFFEVKTRNLLAYDYTKSLDDNLRVFVSPAGFLDRRDPRGKPVLQQGNTVLDFAIGDVNSNRLAFEGGLDQLVSISYTSGVVVVVADVSEIGVATDDTLADITYIEPLDDNNVRAFDTRSSSLIEFQLDYAAFPISVK